MFNFRPQTLLSLFGIWILATTIGCEAMPVPSLEKWKSASLADGKFTIKFPYAPDMKSDSTQNGDKQITSESYSARHRAEIGFSASAANLGIEDLENAVPSMVLDNAVASAASSAKCTAEEFGEISINDAIKGRDVLMIAKSGDHFRVRLYFSKTTGNLYQASVFGASKEIVYGKHATAFFDSIEIEKK